MTRRVLVVGAGVAGLATARALRGVGFEVTVVERRPGAPLPGLGLNLPGNAARALDALGVAEQVLAAGIPVTRREYRTARGRLLFAVDESALEEQRSEKYRHALIAVVSIGVRAGQLGRTVAWLSSHPVSQAGISWP